MENASPADNSNPEPEAVQRQETRQFSRSRGRNKCQFNDLRELLNQKRQNHHDPQGNGPPPEPGYNFLADPLRDNDLDPRNTGDRRPDNYGSGRFSPRQQNTMMFANRNRGGGRGRGRVHSFRTFDQPRQPGGDYRRDDEWKEERTRVDKERMQRQRSDTGGWKREWDAGKEDMWKDQPHNSTHRPQQHSPQHRPTTAPHLNRRYRPPQPRQNDDDDDDQPQELANVDTSNENNYDTKDGANQAYQRPYRKFYSDNMGGNQYRPPQKYNPNYHNRGGRNNYQKPMRARRPNPMNISVEFSAETGQRTCTLEKCRPVPTSRPKRTNRAKKEPANDVLVVECEENWDDDDKEEIKVEKVVENASEISQCADEVHDEIEQQFHEETVENEEPGDEKPHEEEIREHGGEEYDDANEEQYTDAEEKNADADKLKEKNDNEEGQSETENKEDKHESDTKECDNSQVKSESKKEDIADDIKQKEKDSTNDIANCDGEKVIAVEEKAEEDVKKAEVKPDDNKNEDK